MAILALLCLVVVYCVCEVDAIATDSRPVLSLLNVLPYPDKRPFAAWDGGLELIPAGRLAVEQINANPDVLPNHRLELIDIESEACGLTLVTEGLVNSYRHLVDPHSTVVGMVGLFCSSVTNVIAAIGGYPNIALLEIAGSTSPIHRNSSNCRHLQICIYGEILHAYLIYAISPLCLELNSYCALISSFWHN